MDLVDDTSTNGRAKMYECFLRIRWERSIPVAGLNPAQENFLR